jgi:hypothetical protein
MTEFTFGLIVGLIPTIGFIIAVWLAARAGMKLGSILLTGYGTWAISTGVIFLLRNFLGSR